MIGDWFSFGGYPTLFPEISTALPITSTSYFLTITPGGEGTSNLYKLYVCEKKITAVEGMVWYGVGSGTTKMSFHAVVVHNTI